MAVRKNYIPNPSFEVDLASWTAISGTAGGSYWRDTSGNYATTTASVRINNATAQANGLKTTVTLPAGTYTASVAAQILAGTTNAAAAVRRTSDSSILFQTNWTAPNNNWSRRSGSFTLSSSTEVEFIIGVGIFGSTSAGSARFDAVMIEDSATLGTYFDGSTPDTTDTTYAWVGTAHNSASTASSGVVEPPPPPTTTGGWELIETNTFAGQSVLDNDQWYTKTGFAGTSGDGFYSTARVAIVGGVVEITPDGDSIGGFDSRKRPQIYGRWDVWAKMTPYRGYKGVIFLWPDSEVWADGELDFVEMTDSSGATFQIFFHQVGNPTNNARQTRVTQNLTTDFVKFTMEWLPERASVRVNDVLVYETTDRTFIPVKPMHLVVQVDVGIPNGGNGVSARPGYPAPLNPPFKLSVDRVDIYKPASASTTPSLAALDSGGSADTASITIRRQLVVADAGTSTDTANLRISKILVAAVDPGSSADLADLSVSSSASVVQLSATDAGTSTDHASFSGSSQFFVSFDFGTSSDTADLSVTHEITRPEASSLAEAIYSALGPLTLADEATGWHLLWFVNAIAQAPQLTDDLVRDGEAGPGWSSVVDVDRAPAEALAWLGQFVGVEVEPNLDAESQRLRIQETAGFRRGTRAAIEGAARQFLIGNRTVQVLERDTSPYHLKVITFETETPFPDRIAAALQAQKPAGLVLQYELSSGATYAELKATGDTYDELGDTYPTYTQMKLAIPA